MEATHSRKKKLAELSGYGGRHGSTSKFHHLYLQFCYFGSGVFIGIFYSYIAKHFEFSEYNFYEHYYMSVNHKLSFSLVIILFQWKMCLIGVILFQFRSLSDQLYRSPDHHQFVREQIIQQVHKCVLYCLLSALLYIHWYSYIICLCLLSAQIFPRSVFWLCSHGL